MAQPASMPSIHASARLRQRGRENSNCAGKAGARTEMLENEPHMLHELATLLTHQAKGIRSAHAIRARRPFALRCSNPVIARPLQRGRVASTAKIKGRPAKNN